MYVNWVLVCLRKQTLVNSIVKQKNSLSLLAEHLRIEDSIEEEGCAAFDNVVVQIAQGLLLSRALSVVLL